MAKRITAFLLTLLLSTWALIGISAPTFSQSRLSSREMTEIAPAPVILDGEFLFQYQTRLADRSPQERAERTMQVIRQVAADLSIDPSDLTLGEPDPNATTVEVDTTVIAVITEEDARAAGFTRPAVARVVQQRIREAINRYREARTPERLRRHAALAVLYTAIALGVLWLESTLLRRLLRRLRSLHETNSLCLRFGSTELLPSYQTYPLLLQLISWFRVILKLLLIYLYLPAVLSLFPWTKHLGVLILNTVRSTASNGWDAFVEYLPSLVLILTIVYATNLLIRFNHFFFRQVGRGRMQISGFYQEWAAPTEKLTALLLIALATTLVFPLLPGFDSAAFRGVSIFFGVLFSLGSTAIVANVVAGVILIYTRAFEVGNLIRINNTTGIVIEKTLLVTRIRTFDNIFVTLPNGMLLSGEIFNFSASSKEINQPYILSSGAITLGYDLPWRKVHQALLEAASRTSGIMEEPKPFVLQTSLDDFYVSYELKVYLQDGAPPPLVKSELFQNIQDCCVDYDIEILSPHYSAWRDGSESTIPKTAKG